MAGLNRLYIMCWMSPGSSRKRKHPTALRVRGIVKGLCQVLRNFVLRIEIQCDGLFPKLLSRAIERVKPGYVGAGVAEKKKTWLKCAKEFRW